MSTQADARTVSWTLPLTSVAVCWLIAPPLHFEWLVWVAFAPLFVWLVQGGVSSRQAWLGAAMVGTGYYLAISRPLLSLSWWGWGTATESQFAVFVWHQKALILLIIVSLSLWGGLWWALCGWLTKRYATSPLRAVWFIPSLWVLVVEFLAHQTVSGMGWGLLGVHLHEATTLRQLASLAGIPGLSFLVVLVNAAVGLLAGRWPSAALKARRPVSRRPVLASVGLVVGASLLYGMMARRALAASAFPAPLQVAVLQGNILGVDAGDFTPEGLDETYASMLRESLEAGADIVILPETVWLRTLQLDHTTSPWDSPIQLVGRDLMGRTFAKILHGRDRLIIHGIDAVSRGQVYNAMTFWTMQGLIGTYFKRHLVPFAEFTPRGLRWLPPQNRLHGSGFAYAAGREPSLVVFHGIPIGSVICQEILFAEPIRQSVRAGAQLLVSTGNDGVFRDPAVGQTMHAMAVLRAVAHRRYLVRSMKTGISSVIDPSGRVMALAPAGVRAVITAPIAPSSSVTLYDRFGSWLIVLCGGLTALVMLRARRDEPLPRAAGRPHP